MSLDFLKQIKVDDPSTMKKSGGGGARKPWNPTEGKRIRIWASGAVYPNAELVEWFDLEYRAKEAEHQGNAFDVFSSSKLPIFKTPTPLIVINVVDKAKPKTDLFGSVGYVTDAESVPEGAALGDALSSVLDQGATTFGKKVLLPMIKEVYDVEPNEAGYIDLVLIGQDGTDATQKFELSKDFCHVPKAVSRGDNAGAPTYVKRDHPRLYALYPAVLLEETQGTGGGEPQ